MAFKFTVKTDAESVKDYTGDGGKYINQSGIYEIILKSVILEEAASGSQALTLWFEHQGQEQPLFQAMRLTNKDGSENFGADLFNKLLIIGGADASTQIDDPVSRQVPIGKGGENKDCMVFEMFDDMPVYVRVQLEYGMYEGKIQERKHVRNFFRYEDKATAAEIVNAGQEGVVPGTQYAIEEEKYAGDISYKDGLTVEDVNEWKKNRKSGEKKEEAKKPAGGFGGKRFGNKN